MSKRPVNFSAGPAILDESVLAQAAKDVLALDGLGLSILEISHRSPTYDAIITGTYDRLRRLMNIPETHELLFLQGGARGQFAQVPLNFLTEGKRAAYVDTGKWAQGAVEEGAMLGDAYALASSKSKNYNYLPELAGLAPSEDCAYVHTTSNNTIYGTQWQTLPDFGSTRHVCDMSSDIMSRPIDVSRFGLIYAGAQKNAGPAGVTLVIVDKEWMSSGRSDIPVIWQYRTQAAKQSMYNTPPAFAIYCVGLVAKWLEGMGGVEAMATINERKAGLVYDTIEASGGFYRATVADPTHRSRMNITWRLADEALEPVFVAQAAEAGLSGLKGHRSAGGIRASTYNAMPESGVEQLVEFMKAFKARH
jgi:phosphoserine aminotransferase